MGQVLLVGVYPEIDEYLRAALRETRPVDDLANVDEAVARVRSGEDVDAVVLGRRLAEPLRGVQQVGVADPSVAVVVLADLDQRDELARALRYLPFLGEDVTCLPMDASTPLAPEVRAAAERSTQRRAHRATVTALNRRLGSQAPSERPAMSYLGRVLDVAPIGVIVVDYRGVIHAWNAHAARLFESTEREAIGSPVGQFLTGWRAESPSDAPGTNGASGDAPLPQLVERLRRDGSRQVLEMTATPLGPLPREPTLILVQDVTARILAEREREDAIGRERAARAEAEAAVRTRDEFLSVAAHELKTPVTGVRAQAQLLRRMIDRTGTVEPARLRRAVEAMERQSHKLGRLVGELLDVARIDREQFALAPAATDLDTLVREIVEGARLRAPAHTIELRAGGGAYARVDPLRFEQVVVNLLDNALKFSPEDSPILVEVTPRASEVEVAVTDRGIGIPPEHRPHLFSRFFQAHAGTHPVGLGLGLYLSRRIVELLGGQIDAEFPEDAGTRIVVRLPRIEEPPERPP